jgi:hypothetical protein
VVQALKTEEEVTFIDYDDNPSPTPRNNHQQPDNKAIRNNKTTSGVLQAIRKTNQREGHSPNARIIWTAITNGLIVSSTKTVPSTMLKQRKIALAQRQQQSVKQQPKVYRRKRFIVQCKQSATADHVLWRTNSSRTLEYSKFIPMEAERFAGNALSEFFQDVGIPTHIHTDGAKALTEGNWKKVREDQGGVKQTLAEPFSPWQNRAEAGIREHKKCADRAMHKTNAPKKLWNYCGIWVAETRSRTAHPLYSLHGRTPIEHVTGETPDITEWLEYDWYQPVWYRHNAVNSFPEDTKSIGRWLGVAHRIGQAMCYWILPESGIPVARSTVQPITIDELRDPIVMTALKAYDAAVHSKLDGKDDPPEGSTQESTIWDQDDEEVARSEPAEPESTMPEADDYTEDSYDKYISAQVLLPVGDSLTSARVTGRKRDDNGNPVGLANRNPLLDTRIYEVEFPDGHSQEFAANIIAESLYSQVDDEGREFALLGEILDHTKDSSAVSKDDGYVEKSGANPQRRRTTKGGSS